MVTRDDIIRLAGHRIVSPWVMKLVHDANQELTQQIVARLEASCGASASPPLIIKKEFLNATSHTG
jgi:hypothetical protein